MDTVLPGLNLPSAGASQLKRGNAAAAGNSNGLFERTLKQELKGAGGKLETPDAGLQADAPDLAVRSHEYGDGHADGDAGQIAPVAADFAQLLEPASNRRENLPEEAAYGVDGAGLERTSAAGQAPASFLQPLTPATPLPNLAPAPGVADATQPAERSLSRGDARSQTTAEVAALDLNGRAAPEAVSTEHPQSAADAAEPALQPVPAEHLRAHLPTEVVRAFAGRAVGSPGIPVEGTRDAAARPVSRAGARHLQPREELQPAQASRAASTLNAQPFSAAETATATAAAAAAAEAAPATVSPALQSRTAFDAQHLMAVTESHSGLHSSAAEFPAAPSAARGAAYIEAPFGTEAWGEAFGAKIVWLVDRQMQNAELHINPGHLGPVEVSLTLGEEATHIAFVSPHAAVREAIESSLAELRQALDDKGLSLGHTLVSADGGRAREELAREAGARDPARGRSESRAAEIPALAPSPRAPRGLVDLFA